MKTIIAIVVCGLILVVCPTPADAVRDLTPDEYAATLDLFMDGRLDEARSGLDSLADTCAGQPLYLLARARVVLETIPIDDDDKELTSRISDPAFAMLDEVIAWADAGLDRNGDEMRFRYYRGWAWMMKSQLKAFGRDFYGAGRDAGRGKKDIEAYLEVRPDEPIPNGLLGAYLYFTDAVPKLFQFISKLLFLPTGDRDRGLEMINFAVAGDSPARVDYEVLNANVTFFFEGRLEEGLDLANGLLDRYPRYPRLALASAVSAPLDPGDGPEHLARTAKVLARLDGEPGIDRATLETLRCYHGLGLRVITGHDAARAVLEPIAANPPPHPDWAGPFARLQLARMAAAEGRTDIASELAVKLRDADADSRFRDQAERLLEDLRQRSTDASVRAAFSAAEDLLLTGDRRGALEGYRALHARDVATWDEIWRLLASARIGEISATQGNWRGAANWMKRAADQSREMEKLAWVFQGRGRYFKELGKNPSRWPAPTLLPATP